ncbi:Double strand break repair protein rad21 [Echinococcus multilocularis]|uniref:Double strand break repair protein rad21 n=1 Tax=Echinococcus multilocularis TaxID=6211 RepID=A0A068Y1L9_ECHMU|nr:Double strand break repair protein rad21 [Echinococcus multilocularis]
MFYAHFVLSKKGPFSRIWLAAHWDKKLTRAHVFETNINSSVEAILEPKLKMALRTSGHLLLGVVRIYSRKAKYLLADCNEIYVKIKTSFRPGVVDQPDDSNREAALAAINLPENIQDYEATMAALNAINLNTMNINQSRPEDITMREDFGDVNLGRIDDDFGEGAFEELPSREMLRGGDGGYDSVYGRGTDASGRFSVRESDRPSIRTDIDADDTLIGAKDKSDKVATGLTPGADIGLDDDDFVEPLYAGDSDGSFGGDIEPSIFNNPALFEDATTTNQLATLAEGLTLSNEPGATAADGGMKEGGPSMMGVEVITPIGPKSNGATPQVPDQPPLQPQVTANMTSNISNDSEAFALMPIDVPITVTEPRRAAKRKRRLIIDELKSIPSDLMKAQMQDTSEIVTQLDLAPPTKRLMRMKETGGLDKLFTLPGRSLPSRILQRMFSRNLRTQPITNATGQDATPSLLAPDESRPHIFFRSTAPGPAASAIEDHLLSAAATPRDLLSSSGFHAGAHQQGGALGLDAIPEETISVSNQSGYPGYPSASADHHPHRQGDKATVDLHNEHHHDLLADNTLTNLHDPFLAATARPTDIPEHHHVHPGASDDDMEDDDNNFPLDAQYLEPPSVLSEASQGILLEHDLDGTGDRGGRGSRGGHGLNLASEFGGPRDDEDTMPAAPSVGGDLSREVLEGEEIEEERRLEKRSKDMLRRLRAHVAQHGWGESGISLLAMCEGNSKKQAASKFYTMLLLRKQGSVRLFQDAPYSDIRVCRGPAFVGPAETAPVYCHHATPRCLASTVVIPGIRTHICIQADISMYVFLVYLFHYL